jgi:hypothetical protein
MRFRRLSGRFALGFPDLTQTLGDPDLAEIRHDPSVIQSLGLKDLSKMSQIEGWRYDLSLLAQEVHPQGL